MSSALGLTPYIAEEHSELIWNLEVKINGSEFIIAMNGQVCSKSGSGSRHTYCKTDLYYPQNTEDLRKFYDYYMKDVSNDWVFTPKVRLSILNPGGKDIINRPENEFPLNRQLSKKLFLDAKSGTMQWKPLSESSMQFDAVSGEAKFVHTFASQMELTGHFALRLHVEAIGNDDIDLFVKFAKLSKDGKLLESVCIDAGYLQPDPSAEREKAWQMHRDGEHAVDVMFNEGSTGRLRVSHRELDTKLSTPHFPRYTHKKEQKLKPGEIVPVDIEMWPHGMIWEPGQQILLTVTGHDTRPLLHPMSQPAKVLNKGKVVIHTGGSFDSHLLVPYIPL